jgi:hypothetical protein
MRNPRNFYVVLHVQPDAPAEIIRTSYRTLMQRLKMHPDLGGDHGAAALINEAFATLRDPGKRAAYDRWLAGAAQAAESPADTAPPRPERAAEAAAATAGKRTPAGKTAVPARSAGGGASTRRACAFCGETHSLAGPRQTAAVCWRCDSPLFHCGRQARGTGSGRALDRMPRNIAVNVRPSGRQAPAFAVTTEDISINGARFLSAFELAAGQIVKLDGAFCTAVGVVRHAQVEPESRPPRWCIGVEFLTLQIKQPRGAFVSTQV